MSKHIIYGAPGTGKTTTLMEILEKQLNKGINPKNITFCSFSKAAAEEAKERAVSKFNLEKGDIPYFGTIHSICYKRFCTDFEVMQPKDKLEFFKKKNIDYSIGMNDENLVSNEVSTRRKGNLIMAFYDNLRLYEAKDISSISKKELKSKFHNLPISDDNFSDLFVSTFDVYEILRDYREYKKENDLIDFIDMLLMAYRNEWVVPTDILIVDEFQDLSPLQYKIYKLWSRNKEDIYIAGDDDQTIYSFLCADPDFLIDERQEIIDKEGSEEILPVTYRVPEKIHKYCSKYIKENISCGRVDKSVDAFNEGGELVREKIDGNLSLVLDYLREDKETFILFRTNYYKREFIKEVLIPNGIVYDEIKRNITSLWNKRTINLFNACVKLHNKEPIKPKEVKRLLENIPYKLKLLKRGLKTNFKDMDKKNEYNISDLIELGFDLKFFDIVKDYDKIFNILKLKESVKMAFRNRDKEVIERPINLKLGTIHSSKGKEADDVIIFKDINKRVVDEITENEEKWDDEIRLFYVGMTRAKERLVILRDAFNKSYSSIIP